ncbi:NAD-dependent epimerase/dehydratase family protein [Terrabacter sp. C0L_2]|uniref:NAD-dependent epimerase/dehydratase family protein n=1 Tax=Terrabacter sp. C0L_2 TaxID=3108389 RepID=UPI002ED47FF7|nr:NAD-dependent epimerase/dehydratase family protein [Terrabacter sp. C0L_2]
MTTLVTGGAGFIGSHVVEALVRDGHRVRVLDSLRPDVHGPAPDLSPLRGLRGVEVVVGDTTSTRDVAGALVGCDRVVHLAAKVGLGVDFADTEDYVHTNATGTAVLLGAMARADVRRLVLASPWSSTATATTSTRQARSCVRARAAASTSRPDGSIP